MALCNMINTVDLSLSRTLANFSMVYPRFGADGVVLPNGSYFVTGGSLETQATEVLTEGRFEIGPNLPLEE